MKRRVSESQNEEVHDVLIGLIGKDRWCWCSHWRTLVRYLFRYLGWQGHNLGLRHFELVSLPAATAVQAKDILHCQHNNSITEE